MPLKIILKFCVAVQSKTGFSSLSIGGNGMLLTMLSLVIKSSIQIVLLLFNSVEWDWNTICDRDWGFCFFHYLALFLNARAHPWLLFHNSAVHNSSGAETCHKKQLTQSSFLVVDRKHDRFVLFCVSAFHGRAISGQHGNQALHTSLFCWHSSLKSLWPPENGRIEEHRAILCPSSCPKRELWRAQISLPRLWVVL